MVASLFGGATVLALHKGALDSDVRGDCGVARLARRGPHSSSPPIRRGCAEATPGRPLATAAVPAFLVADLAWNNGPNEFDGAAARHLRGAAAGEPRPAARRR